ncbi:MAG TPA: DNA-3-methyladenine glycosylase [Steroidobacteraceae bacterium]|nr:DNA-3-methyladenine glycosylase [Steroidobacteraceae bacterium]
MPPAKLNAPGPQTRRDGSRTQRDGSRTRRDGSRLPRSFYARPALAVAPDLLGLRVVHNDGGTLRVGRIVETEAYMGPQDLAAHSAGGRRTGRTEVMFGPPGHAYVYLIYGFWNCLNVVTSPVGRPHAVLLRAVEPLAHLEHGSWGPGLLCRAFNIDRRLNGVDLRGDRLWIERPRARAPAVRVGTSARIGVDYAGAWADRPWRFFDRDSPFVSTLTPAARRRAGITV